MNGAKPPIASRLAGVIAQVIPLIVGGPANASSGR
jgi:hypothetical protein